MKKTYLRTLHHLPETATQVWLFESDAARTTMMQHYAAKGQTVIIRSAYKTLLHEVMEQGLLLGQASVNIAYPVIAGDEALRFRMECYPLDELYPHCAMTYQAKPEQTLASSTLPSYTLTFADGSSLDVAVPVQWKTLADGHQALVACAWMIDKQGQGQAIYSEYEQIFDACCAHFATIPLTGQAPYFEQLVAEITLPVKDKRLPIGDEQISLLEALHEDLYFSALEIFAQRLQLPVSSRALQPGQVAPLVRYGETPTLALYTQSYAQSIRQMPEPPALLAPLDKLTHWLNPSDIAAYLEALGGEPLRGQSLQGRALGGCIIRQQGRAQLAISAGQHANESSGIVGALRAGYALKAAGEIDFSLRPLGNPDGYALFRQLCADNPNHMHHAARYTAFGCDLAYGNSHETHFCQATYAAFPAEVHVNLHGYPAHEWTRPLSGYIPRGFSQWMLAKGFFLICRYHPDDADKARYLLDVAIRAVASYPAQRQQNQQMLARYLRCMGTANFAIQEDVPYLLEAYPNGEYPIEIITEAPDETIYGETFRIAHESHYRVVMAIADALKSG